MSLFTQIAAEASEVIDDVFGDPIQFRNTSNDDWSEAITGRLFNERIENRKAAHGWERVKLFDIGVKPSDIPAPLMHMQFRADGDDDGPIYTMVEYKGMRSNRLLLSVKQTRVGEISRPNLRR